MRTFSRLLCLCLVATGVRAETPSPLLQAMREELTRSSSLLAEQPVSPYFLENAIFVYKVYLDGREELVRNAEFAGIGLYTFKDIVQVSKTHAVNTVPFRSEDNSSPFSRGRSDEVLVSIVTPRLILFEDITLKPPSGEIPKAPVSVHPYFDK